jgi:hypothetical protein
LDSHEEEATTRGVSFETSVRHLFNSTSSSVSMLHLVADNF